MQLGDPLIAPLYMTIQALFREEWKPLPNHVGGGARCPPYGEPGCGEAGDCAA